MAIDKNKNNKANKQAWQRSETASVAKGRSGKLKRTSKRYKVGAVASHIRRRL